LSRAVPVSVLRIRLPPRSPLLPYTTLFRSPPVRRALRVARGRDRGAGGDAAGARRSQDEQELRQHHPAVRAARGAQEADLFDRRSEEHTSELQSRENLVCRLLLENKKPSRI